MRSCTVDGCDRPHHARGFCKQHYNGWYAAQGLTPTRQFSIEPAQPNPAHLAALRRHAALIRHAARHNSAYCPECRAAVALVEGIAGLGRAA